MKKALVTVLILVATGCASPMAPYAGVGSLSNYANILESDDPVDQLISQLSEIPGYQGNACDYWYSEYALSISAEIADIKIVDYNQNGRPAYVLTKHFRTDFNIETEDSGAFYVGVIVPTTFSTDLFSIPEKLNAGVFSWLTNRINLRKVLWQTQDGKNAAIVHDWLYAIGDPDSGLQRQIADQSMVSLMREAGLSRKTIDRVYFGISRPSNNSHGRRGELRFYNKCFYDSDYNDVCDKAPFDLLRSPVLDIERDTPLTQADRQKLRDATVCVKSLG